MGKNAAVLVVLSLSGLALAGPPKAPDRPAREVEAQKAELARLRDALKKEQARALALERENRALRDRAVQAEIAAVTLKQRAADLTAQVGALTQQIARLRAAPAGGRGKLPALENVEGLVKAIAADGKLTITIGSDAGLVKGHTLEVFRLKPAPKYLGTVEIVEVSPRQAVARVKGRMIAPIQVGDQVASRLQGR